MKKIRIKDEYIKLEQAMKLGGAIGSGAEAKHEIQEGQVQVNGETELRRGRKLRDGDIFTYLEESWQIEAPLAEGER